MAERWEGDDREHGIGDATQLVSGASDLIAAFSHPTWVAEQAEIHLLPHIEGWCRQDPRLALTGARTDGVGAFVLDLEWHGGPGTVGNARAAVYGLIGSFAESATYIRQRRLASDGGSPGADLRFEIGTGELASDARFDPHGHVVVINLAGVLQGQAEK